MSTRLYQNSLVRLMPLISILAVSAIAPMFLDRVWAEELRESILDRKIAIETEHIRDIPQVPRFCDGMRIPKQRIDVGGCALYCEREGKGPSIVLLHGGPGATHHYFHPSFSRAAAFAQVIYYDQRGCGLSDYTKDQGYTVDQAVDDLENLRKGLRVDKWIVLGHSYGGLLAQCYVVKYPDSVRGLVLVGASPAQPYAGGSREGDFLSQEEQRAIRDVKSDTSLSLAQNLYNSFLNGDWKRQCFYKPSRERIAQIALYEWVHDTGFNNVMSRCASQVNLRGVFDTCPIPTLIMEGKWDLTWGADKAAMMQASHPGSTLVRFDNAGHEPFDDDPDEFFAALKGFVDGLKEPSDADMTQWKARLVAQKESLPAVLQASGWGRKSSEMIAKAYSKKGLTQLSSTDTCLRTGFALYDAKRYEDALDVFKKMSGMAGDNRMDRGIALVWQGHMLDLLGKRDEAVHVYKEAADLNANALMQHDQYGLTYNLGTYPQERIKEPFVRLENRYDD